MTDRQHEILRLLLEQPTPFESKGGHWLDYIALGLNESDTPDLLALMSDENLNFALEDTKEVWVPMHCWRALAQLRVLEALEPILEMREKYDDDDWLSSDLVAIPAMIGKKSLPILSGFLKNSDKSDYSRANVCESIARLGNCIPEIKADCIQVIRDQLEKYEHNDPELNGFLVWSLQDMDAVDCHDIIRRAYESDAVELDICGDLEDVEIDLGLRKERSTPSPRYLNFPDNFCLPESNPYADPSRYTPAGSPIRGSVKVGRNDPCPCGSGKKYKKCCLN